MPRTRLAQRADDIGRYAAIALGFSIPVSVFLDNVLLAVVLGGWLAGGAYRAKVASARDNPVCIASLLLVTVLALGMLHGDHPRDEAIFYFQKYLDLLFIPVFAWQFREPAARRYGLHALAGALVLTLAVSFCLKSGVLPAGVLGAGSAASPTVFKLRLTHNILMALGAFLFAWLAMTAGTREVKAAWGALALLAAVNVTMMVQGATGYLVLGALALLFGYGVGRWRGLGVSVIAVAAVAAMLTYVPGPFRERVGMVEREFRGWQATDAQSTSMGLRLEFYHNTLRIIRDHPVAGVGTGGFPQAYARVVAGSPMGATRNPHNEFLHLAAQVGPLGVAALLWLLFRQWRLAPGLAPPDKEIARGLVVLMAIGCMLNSLLLDHTEGLLYAWLTGLLYATVESTGKK
jgi:O-antigen ligase